MVVVLLGECIDVDVAEEPCYSVPCGDSTLHNKLPPLKKAVFRTQAAGAESESNPDPDPDQGFFMTKIIFFDKKCHICLLKPLQRTFSSKRSLQPIG